MSRLRLYYDLMSQPCRALYILFKCSGIPFDESLVSIQKNEQNKPEFVSINPFRKVPALVEQNGEDRFILRESCAIARYVTSKYLSSSQSWFPNDNKKATKVDEFLHWQHTNIRQHASMVFLHGVALPVMTRSPPDFNKLHRFKGEMEETIKKFESHYLSDGGFIAGDEISVADLFAICELRQPWMAGFDVAEQRPRLTAWMEDVMKETQPHFDAAHAPLVHVREMMAEGLQEAYSEFLEEKCQTISAN